MRTGKEVCGEVVRWFLDDKLHRNGDLPAVECIDGYKAWYLYGKCYHRQYADGSGIIFIGDEPRYYWNRAGGEQLMRLKAFL